METIRITGAAGKSVLHSTGVGECAATRLSELPFREAVWRGRRVPGMIGEPRRDLETRLRFLPSDLYVFLFSSRPVRLVLAAEDEA